MAATLKHLAQNCHGDGRPDCPILEGLQNRSPCVQAATGVLSGRGRGRALRLAHAPASNDSNTAMDST